MTTRLLLPLLVCAGIVVSEVRGGGATAPRLTVPGTAPSRPAAPSSVRISSPAEFSRRSAPVARPVTWQTSDPPPTAATEASSPPLVPLPPPTPPSPPTVPPAASGSTTTPPISPGAVPPPGAGLATPAAPAPGGALEEIPGPERMELADFEGLALANHPTLGRAGATIRAAQGNWLQVGLYPNPFLGYNGTEIGQEGRAGQQGAYFGQLIVLGGKLRLNRAVATQEIREAQQLFGATRLRVLTDVRLRYIDVVVARRSVELTRNLVELGERGVQAAEALLKAQEVSRFDVLQARIERDQARLQLVRAENRFQAAWRGLTAAVAMPGLVPVPLEDILSQPPPEREWDTVYMQLQGLSPELGAAQARVARAAFAVERAVVQPIPDLDNQFMVQHDNATTDDIAMVQSVVVIPLWDRNQGAIRQNQAQLAAARADYRRVQLSLQSRLALAFERYANARQLVERYSRDILPNAQAEFDLAATGYRQGEFPFLTYLIAQRTYFQVNLAYVDGLRELWQSAAVIDGLLLTDGLETGN